MAGTVCLTETLVGSILAGAFGERAECPFWSRLVLAVTDFRPQLVAQGAVVVISHNHDFVSSVCTEEWHVGGGKVLAEGNPAYEAAKEKAGKEAKKAAEKAEKEAKKAAR